MGPAVTTAPMICPSTMIGMPPCSGVKSGSVVIVVRPLLIMSSKNFVGLLNRTAVRALPMEILAPAAKVLSRRSTAIRLPPSSMTAMAPPGAFLFLASATAAAITFFAPSQGEGFFLSRLGCADGMQRQHDKETQDVHDRLHAFSSQL